MFLLASPPRGIGNCFQEVCYKYWPTEASEVTFGEYSIKLLNKELYDLYTERTIEIKNKMKVRIVTIITNRTGLRPCIHIIWSLKILLKFEVIMQLLKTFSF